MSEEKTEETTEEVKLETPTEAPKEDDGRMSEEEATKIANQMMVGIQKGYEEAKVLAKSVKEKTIGGWFTTKDFARMCNNTEKAAARLLSRLDMFGMVKTENRGGGLIYIKINEDFEFMMQRFFAKRRELQDEMMQLSMLIEVAQRDKGPKENEEKDAVEENIVAEENKDS